MKTKNKSVSVPFFLIGTLFCISLLTANLLETKVIQVWNITFTGGFLVFPISYILNDCISEVYGFKKARLIIWTGFLMNLIFVLFCKIAVALPSAPFWEGDEAFRFVFDLAPRILIASLCAFLIGSFLNAFVISKMKIANNGRNFSVRAVLSSLAGEFADSIIFFPIAFGGLMPLRELLKIMAIQIIAKTLYEVVMLPFTKRLVKHLKKVEDTDTFDNDISYNIFKIKDL
ncbi:MAG: queuosine precursor transporter [Bacteroidales bacterium]|nr:queuosine precursor transporter [Bacteroidales bacterium]